MICRACVVSNEGEDATSLLVPKCLVWYALFNGTCHNLLPSGIFYAKGRKPNYPSVGELQYQLSSVATKIKSSYPC